jgi:hypothetical protein
MKRQNSCLAVSLLLLFAMIPNVYPATILPRKSSRMSYLLTNEYLPIPDIFTDLNV